MDAIKCNYNNGRPCPKNATHVLKVIGLEFFACNGHRVATANMVAEQIPGAEIVRTELPR